MRLSRAAALLAAAAVANAVTYDAGSGLDYVYLSAAAYCDQGPVTSWSCAACSTGNVQLSEVQWLEDITNENFGFVGLDSSSNVYVSYRGTFDVTDWIHNLDFTKVSYPGCSGCEVHQGFYGDYTGLSGQLVQAVNTLGGSNAPNIFVTGHSLGAAIAQLTAFELALAGYPFTQMINFGQPRVGDSTYASAYTSMVVAGNDGAFLTRADGKPMRLNVAALMNRNATQAPVSALLAKGIERALNHELNKNVGTPAQRAALMSLIHQHARLTLASRIHSPSRVPLRAELAKEHIAILSQLRLPAPVRGAAFKQPVAGRNLRSSANLKGGFLGAASFRVVHNEDVVPHVPPELFGFTHSVEEIWYNEASSSYTSCSTTNGEDPNCSDSIALPTSISDHLTYLGVPISNSC